MNTFNFQVVTYTICNTGGIKHGTTPVRVREYMFNDLSGILMISRFGIVLRVIIMMVVQTIREYMFNDLSRILMISRFGIVPVRVRVKMVKIRISEYMLISRLSRILMNSRLVCEYRAATDRILMISRFHSAPGSSHPGHQHTNLPVGP
jgi:hypothetical protein